MPDVLELSGEDKKAAALIAERRRSHRRAYTAAGWISSEVGTIKSSEQEILVTDLSLQGIGFRVKKPLRVAGQYWIMVRPTPVQLSSRIQVVHCRPRPDGTFDIGAEFY